MIKFANGQILNPTSYCYQANGFIVHAGSIKIGEEAWLCGMSVSLGIRVSS